MVSKMNMIFFFLIIVLIGLAQAGFTAVPPPPKRPDFFRSKEELKRYLQKVHEYHLIVGRWRLRREYNNNDPPFLSSTKEDLFKLFDINNDQLMSNAEFVQQLKFTKKELKI